MAFQESIPFLCMPGSYFPGIMEDCGCQTQADTTFRSGQLHESDSALVMLHFKHDSGSFCWKLNKR